MQAAYHLDVFKVGIAQLHLAFHKFLLAIQHEQLIFAASHIIRSVGQTQHILFHGIHHVNVRLQAGAQATVAVIIQLYGERDHSVFGQRGYAGNHAFQFLAADFHDGPSAGSHTVAIGIGNLGLHLEVAQVGNDGDLRTLGHLRTHLVIHIGQDGLTRRTDLRIV